MDVIVNVFNFMTIGTDGWAEFSTVSLGTSIKSDDLQKSAQKTRNNKPKEMDYLNKMIDIFLKTSNKETSTKDTLERRNNFTLSLP